MTMDGYFSDTQAMPSRNSSDRNTASSNLSPFTSETSPYQTPFFSGSRRSSGRLTPTSAVPITPPLFPTQNNQTGKKSNEETRKDGVQDIDPSQFTESLHASLVAEILSLRRDLEAKNGFIEGLESDLSSSRNHIDSLEAKLGQNAREARSVKKQLQQIEDSTLKAVEEIAKDRDDSRALNAELKRRLETTQQKNKALEADTKRLHDVLERERQGWDGERAQLQLKASNADKKLQAVVDEFTIQQELLSHQKKQLQQQQILQQQAQLRAKEDEPPSIASGRASLNGSPVKRHIRGASSISTLGSRKEKPGLSLADELDNESLDSGASDSGNDDILDDDQDMDTTLLPDEAAIATTHQLSATDHARNVAGIVSHYQSLSRAALITVSRTSSMTKSSLDSLSQTQLSLDESRSNSAADPENAHATPDKEQQIVVRESIPSAADEPSAPFVQGPVSNPGPTAPHLCDRCRHSMSEFAADSVGTQTDDDLPRSQTDDVPHHDDQTDFVNVVDDTKIADVAAPMLPPSFPPPPPPPPSRAPPPPPMPEIPKIAIHPPESTRVSPRSTMLPSTTRHAASQTDASVEAKSPSAVDAGMQTDVIRVDPRALKLPSRLSAILQRTSLSTTQEDSELQPSTAVTGRDQELPKVADHTISPLLDSPIKQSLPDADNSFPKSVHEEADDERDAPTWASIRRSLQFTNGIPSNIGSLETAEPQGLDLSDDDEEPISTFSRPPRTSSRMYSTTSTPLRDPNLHSNNRPATASSIGSFDLPSPKQKASYMSFHRRRKSFKSDSTMNHSRTSSGGSSGRHRRIAAIKGPPYAIPTRSSSRYGRSSRRLKNAASSSPTRSADTLSRLPDVSSTASKSKPPPLRKARSAAALRVKISEDESLRSDLTPRSVAFSIEEEPEPGFATKNRSVGFGRSKSLPRSSKPPSIAPTGGASVAGFAQFSVVDAITATMIGEWMFKYMRKRKSFGVTEDKDDFGSGSDARHKRWVWISPYERTIMWSSKQPTSNQALLGKNGRKLPIQSVLDVKDDTPPPKGVSGSEVFNRSILVLTPVRALKITAPCRDRHYLWLTALSFLAHNTSHGVPDLRFLPGKIDRQNGHTPASGPSSNHSRNSSTRHAALSAPFRSMKSKTSMQSSGVATPNIIDGRVAPGTQFLYQEASEVPETALAPTVPRVPHFRKRSRTNPTASRSAFSGSTIQSPSSNGRDRGHLSSNTSLNSTRPTLHTSGASSIRHLSNNDHIYTSQPLVLEEHEMPSFDPRDYDGYHPHHFETSPRQSAEFGGNSNFFDAVGVMRVDAFTGPGIGDRDRPKNDRLMPSQASFSPMRPFRAAVTRSAAPMLSNASSASSLAIHKKNENSQDSFIGPPDISRSRRDPPRSREKEEKKWGKAAKSKNKARENEKSLRTDMGEI